MNTDIATDINLEISEIAEKLQTIGWKVVDKGYITKNIGISTNPDARKEEWKTSLGLGMWPQLLTYHDGISWVTIPWICIQLGISSDDSVKYPEDSKRLKEVCDFILNEFRKINLKPFFDEDAYRNHFSKPQVKQNLGQTICKLYVNPSFPDGVWSNHTL